VKTKLRAFGKDKSVENIEKELTGISAKWSSLSDDERGGIENSLGAIANNIESFANAKEDPVGAIQGAMEIIGTVASVFGPFGQLVGMGAGFISSILGLFGGGPEATPISEIISKEIRKVFEEYRDQDLENEAAGVMNALSEMKGYLDGFSRAGRKGRISITSSRTPITKGSEFVGKLLKIVRDMFQDNQQKQAGKCLKYVELYAKITALRDIIVTQSIAISDDEDDIAGLVGFRAVMRTTAKAMLENLYVVNYGSQILPYFDPDNSPTTDAYATAILDLGKYDRSLADGLYCLKYYGDKYFSWDRSNKWLLVLGKPYTMLTPSMKESCFWKLVPHGRSTYSIINTYRCQQKYDYCGAMLSFDDTWGTPYVTIQHDKPMLWEINGYSWRR